jgi:hypothetical protein
MDPRVVDFSASHTLRFHGDDQCRYTLPPICAGSHGRGTIICKDAVGDPFLGAVDNVYITTSLCGSGDACDIGTSYKDQVR